MLFHNFKWLIYIGIVFFLAFLVACNEQKKETSENTPLPEIDYSKHMDHSAPANPAGGQQVQGPFLKQVETKYVCMVNNKLFPTVQIPVEFEGRTYYGCCEGCKASLQVKAELRQAQDPLTGELVDKATAVIGAMPDGIVLYFANETNFQKFLKTHS